MKKRLIYWLAAFAIVVVGCQKELSFEGSNTPANGSLQSDITGDCLPKTVNGTYMAATPLVPATNTISVQVNVVKTGTFVVSTDTVNGFYFRAVGIFTTLGANNVILRGFGTPFAAGVNNFIVNFDTTFCDIQVTVISPGIGTLAGSPGSCAPITVNGAYSPGVALTASNNVVVQVDITTAGLVKITTDTLAGIWFSFTGTLPLGTGQNVTLAANGSIPAATTPGPQTFKVKFGTSQCTFVVVIAPQVTGTLGGGPGACTPVTVNGNYYQNVPLTAANTVQVQITTSTVGPYSVSTNTVAGFSFSGSGTSTGATQTITLNGTGTPTATGTQNFTVTFGTSTCTFTVPVSAGGTFVADCSTATVNGTYQAGTPLNTTNTVDIDINVTALGPFNITTAVTNGMTFSKSGTFTVLGVQTITLVGSGTPTAAGTFNIPMPGTTPCTFPVTCSAAPVINWSFKIGTTTYQGSSSTIPGEVDYDNTTAPPFIFFTYVGYNAALDEIDFDFIDLTGGINAAETYNTKSQGLTNLADFYFTDGAGTLDLSADPTDTSVGIIFTVQTHNTATKTITGIFSGTVNDSISSTVKTITNGTFTITYP
jgi:hypothetical protein